MNKKLFITILVVLAIASFFGGKFASNLYHKHQQKKNLIMQMEGSWKDAADANCVITLNADGTMKSSVKGYEKWDLEIDDNRKNIILKSKTSADTLEISLLNPTLLVVKQHERTSVFVK